MKRITLFALAFLCAFGLFAQKSFETTFNQPSDGVYDVSFDLNNWNINEITVDGNTYQYVDMNISTVTQRAGWAELPIISATIQLSKIKNVDFEVIYTDYTDINLDHPMLPSRGVIYRNQDPSEIPYVIAPESQINSFYPAEFAKMEEPFIFRDVRGTSVRLTPFQYNAVTNTLRVYSSVQIRLIENEDEPTNPLLSDNVNTIKDVEGIYENMFINYSSATKASASLSMTEYGDILIITTSEFESTMAPYIQWKKEKGYNVSTTVVSVGTNVETTIQNAYNSNSDLMFVQLVGDWADIKSPTISSYGIDCPIDPYMGTVSGTDDYIDISVGRFSCATTTDLTIQINKAIDYEKSPDMTSAWRETFIGVGSSDGSGIGDDSEVDYTHVQRVYNDRLDGFTYDTHRQNYAPSDNAATLAGHINAGASTIAYCGHGDVDMFVTTGFNNTNINSLTNGDKLPFIVSVACVNGAFHTEASCFAETWLRKSNGGAVVTWMSTINQPWQPPQRGQDYFYDILIGGFNYDTDGIANTTGYNTTEQRTHWGSIVVNTAVLMLTESPTGPDVETIQTWTTFGDAALQLRTKTPDALTLSNSTLVSGADFSGTAYVDGVAAENVLICISQNDVYYSTISNGSGAYTISHDFTPGDVLLVATAFNSSTVYSTVDCVGDPCEPVVNVVGTSTGSSVTLTWEAPISGNVTGYNIYREGTLQTTVSAASLTYTQNSVPNGTYEYCVNAIFDGSECFEDVCATVVVNDGSNSSCESPTSLMINEDDPTTHTLSWTAPAGSNNIFDDIEDHTAFTINSAGHVPWTFIDGDATTTYGISDYTFTNSSLEMATIVFDPTLVLSEIDGTPLTETTAGTPFTAYSGSQFFASFNAGSSTQTNDWIISPELNFAAPFEFTFQARSGHKTAYAEDFVVTYSTTTAAEGAFTNTLETVVSAPFAWTEYTYTVPANAKYVAINCVSNDQYYFCVDDIYIGDGSAPTAALTGYNIYIDGIFHTNTDQTTYTNVDADTDSHEYCIEAVYADNCISPQTCETIGITIIEYDIIASAGAGGSITPTGTTTLEEGESQAYSISADPCYEIDDVLVDGSSVGAVSSYNFNSLDDDHTIVASFAQITYTVSESAGTGGSISVANSVNCGDDLIITFIPDACNEVTSATVNGTPITVIANSFTISDASENISIVASFAVAGSFEISTSPTTGGSINPTVSVVSCGEEVSFTLYPDACYTIGTATVNGTPVTLSGDSYTISNVTEEILIGATFNQIMYSVATDAGTGGSITGVTSTIGCGDNLIFSVVPEACYIVVSLTVNGTPYTIGQDPYTINNISENMNIEASFELLSYTISANSGSGGSITPTGDIDVDCGTNQIFTMTPDVNYIVNDVLVNGLSVGAVTEYTFNNIDDDASIIATFQEATGISSISSNTITVFPNPAENIITVELNITESNASSISIMSVDGKIIKQVNISEDNTTIDITDLASGIYFLNVASGNESLQIIKLIRL